MLRGYARKYVNAVASGTKHAARQLWAGSRWHGAGRPRSVILWLHSNGCGVICRVGYNRHESEGECFL